MYASWHTRSRDISFSCVKGGKRKSEKKRKRKEKRVLGLDRAADGSGGFFSRGRIIARHFLVYASSRAALSHEAPIIGGFTISTFSR